MCHDLMARFSFSDFFVHHQFHFYQPIFPSLSKKTTVSCFEKTRFVLFSLPEIRFIECCCLSSSRRKSLAYYQCGASRLHKVNRPCFTWPLSFTSFLHLKIFPLKLFFLSPFPIDLHCRHLIEIICLSVCHHNPPTHTQLLPHLSTDLAKDFQTDSVFDFIFSIAYLDFGLDQVYEQ